MEIVDGTIQSYDERGVLTVVADYPNTEKFLKCGYKTARIVLNDSRTITPEQRKKAYALLGEINDYTGEMPEYTKRLFKLKFVAERQKELADNLFSLSDCSVTQARDFIDYLVDFILEYDIPTKVPLVELCDDIKRYVYACATHKKCAVCGKKAELHHVDAVGMGNDRKEIDHFGRLALPLCRVHHAELHDVGNDVFAELHHLEAVKIDDKLIKLYKFGGKKHE